ncbi:hypothetical protein ABEW79_17985 [Delftia tsuruhatensis]|uniref:hypothetical protein n=1 Tax=Delftia tsuruhatensis TaxID=180282 RepID=UPI003D198AE3
MNRDDVIRWAREAGVNEEQDSLQVMERFAVLVAAAERSACAKLCMDKAHKMESEAVDAEKEGDGNTRDDSRATAWVLAVCSQEILARKDKP